MAAEPKKGMGILAVIDKGSRDGGGQPSEPDEDDDVLSVDDDEVEAMRAFDDASSPEEKAKALKAFIKLCGGY